MMAFEEFRSEAHKLVDWIADYYKNADNYPVNSQVAPGDIASRLPVSPPDDADAFQEVFADVENIIIPGITHWQSPNFFAYFPANSSFPSLLGEMLTAALGAQCMKWETSPAATELEEVVMKWLQQMTGLPDNFKGVIQDTASTATLCAVLTAREKKSNFTVNQYGFYDQPVFRVYSSSEAHSSVDKAVRIAGIGHENLIKIPVDDTFKMDTVALKQAIDTDLKQGYVPLCVVAALGTTGSTAVDPLDSIAEICDKYNIWLHVDAAFAGSALILPEYRWMIKGIEKVDSFVFNPHKWLFTNFDCSAYFVRDSDALIKTFQVVPEYLRSQVHTHANDYSNWGIQLGRRFRALKLWFVIRMFGVKGLQEKIRFHISLAAEFERRLLQAGCYEILAPRQFNLICFRYKPNDNFTEDQLNELNENLLKAMNRTGNVYISHTRLNGKYTLRFITAQTNTGMKHIDKAWQLLIEKSAAIFSH
ncbi:MAG: aminotransferase class I/II-fold pyridoxal phosphate-dependent enzyme [Bacteroidales bacterium]|nr:aminotransferase class I/II-fold pyridoxal phosphate-dependent enzyme [Bacteroidales bacterium]